MSIRYGIKRKRLASVGNSHGVIVHKSLLLALKLQKGSELEMTTDGERIYFKPVHASAAAPPEEPVLDAPLDTSLKPTG